MPLPVSAGAIRKLLRDVAASGPDDHVLAVGRAGFGLRALARELLDLAPGAGWVLKSAIAYGGTRALGEAARIRFALASTQQQPAGAARAAP